MTSAVGGPGGRMPGAIRDRHRWGRGPASWREPASSGCRAAPGARRRLADPTSPADFALVLARRPGAGVAAPPGRAGRTSGSRSTAPTRWTRCGRSAPAGRSPASGWRSPAGAGSDAPGRRWRRSPSSTGCTPGRRRSRWVRARATTRAAVETPVAAVVAAAGVALTRGHPRPGEHGRGRVPLGCLHNYTGGEWSRLRSGDQGKRAEEGNDDLVNHPLQKTQAPIPISATSLSLPDGS